MEGGNARGGWRVDIRNLEYAGMDETNREKEVGRGGKQEVLFRGVILERNADLPAVPGRGLKTKKHGTVQCRGKVCC